MLSMRQIVLQSQHIHPDWTAMDHVHYLVHDEFRTFSCTDEEAAWQVKRWMDDHRAMGLVAQ